MGISNLKVHINVARLKKAGHVFEVVIDPPAAMAYKNGKGELVDALKSEHVFNDAHKGMFANEHLMKEFFGTTDPMEVAAVIIQQGEVQLTAEYRAAIREERERQLIEQIHRSAVDPQTGIPHPPERIRRAMQEAKVHIDEHKSIEEQVPLVVKAIRAIIPISIETRKIQFLIPAHFTHQALATARGMGTIGNESWQPDGSWLGTVEVPAGLQGEILGKMNAISHGHIEAKILGKE